jgi:hypothetical protein
MLDTHLYLRLRQICIAQTTWRKRRDAIHYGLKEQQDHGRWIEAEFEIVREELVRRSIEDVAKKLNQRPQD